MFALMPWRRARTAMLPRTETPFGRMSEEFERLFERFFSWPMMEIPEEPNRALTMEEKEKEVVMRAELPGFTPEEVRVEWLGGQLMIEAEHKAPAEGAEPKSEREYAHVRRSILLPTGVEPEKAEATFRNGVLEIHLPRTPEAAARRIEVKT